MTNQTVTDIWTEFLLAREEEIRAKVSSFEFELRAEFAKDSPHARRIYLSLADSQKSKAEFHEKISQRLNDKIQTFEKRDYPISEASLIDLLNF